MIGGQRTAVPTVSVNFQVSPLVNIVDVVKQRRNFKEEIDSQTWLRGTGRKRTRNRDGMNNLISSKADLPMPFTTTCATEITVGGMELARKGVIVNQVLHVDIVDDNNIPSVRDTFESEIVKNDEIDEDPLQLFKN